MCAETDLRNLTQLLLNWKRGDAQAAESLFPLIYDELRRLASSYLRRERSDHTLQSTALVHEAFLKLTGQQVSWQGRAHFFGIAAQIMRRLLCDHARAKGAGKRGGAAIHIDLNEQIGAASDGHRDSHLAALDEALDALAALDPRQARIVELRYFGGLTIDETADALELSTPTVKRDWATARLFLARYLKSAAAAAPSQV